MYQLRVWNQLTSLPHCCSVSLPVLHLQSTCTRVWLLFCPKIWFLSRYTYSLPRAVCSLPSTWWRCLLSTLSCDLENMSNWAVLEGGSYSLPTTNELLSFLWSIFPPHSCDYLGHLFHEVLQSTSLSDVQQHRQQGSQSIKLSEKCVTVVMSQCWKHKHVLKNRYSFMHS